MLTYCVVVRACAIEYRAVACRVSETGQRVDWGEKGGEFSLLLLLINPPSLISSPLMRPEIK